MKKISGTSKVNMLPADSTPGSAGYVAIELLKANLAGLEGEFALQHFGLMSAEGQSLQLLVVPDSGTDELKGLSGRMDIRIEAGVHYYDFEYEFKA